MRYFLQKKIMNNNTEYNQSIKTDHQERSARGQGTCEVRWSEFPFRCVSCLRLLARFSLFAIAFRLIVIDIRAFSLLLESLNTLLSAFPVFAPFICRLYLSSVGCPVSFLPPSPNLPTYPTYSFIHSLILQTNGLIDRLTDRPTDRPRR